MSSDLGKSVGGRVRELRQQQRLTLDQLSGTSGLPPESISRVERGRTTPSLRTLDCLARGLGVQLVDLLSDTSVETASADEVPARVRGVALLLADADEATIAKARRIVEILVE